MQAPFQLCYAPIVHSRNVSYVGSRSHSQHDRNVQRRSSSADLWLHLLLGRCARYCSILGGDGIDGSNLRRAVPLGLHACTSQILRLPKLDHWLERCPWLDSQPHRWCMVQWNYDLRSPGSQLPILHLRALAWHTYPLRRFTLLCNRQHPARTYLPTY